MKNNKGFTLIELIAMLTVLAILMAITVPNMTGIINQQKETAFIEDTEQLINTSQMKILSNKDIKYPAQNNCIVMSMDFLDKGKEITKAADGGEYVREESFVVIKRVGTKIEYTVRLIEATINEEVYGVDMVEKTIIEKQGTNILAYAEIENYNINTTTPEILKTMDPFVTMCTTIEAVYN